MKTRTILVGIFFALVAAYTPASYSSWITLQHMLAERGWNASPSEPGGPELVIRVDAGGPASDLLRVDDEIIAINGQSVERSDYRMENVFRQLNPDDAYTLTIRRDGVLRDLTLSRNRISLFKRVITSGAITTMLSSAIFLLIGIAVFVVKPDDKQALLLSLWLVLMASAFSLPQPFEGTAWWYRALIVFGQVTKVFAPTFLLHLFLVFPEPSPVLKRWPRLEQYIYVPTLLLVVLPNAYMMILWAVAPEELFAFSLRYPWVGTISAIVLPVTILLALLALVLSYRRAGQVSKRKLRIVLVGTLVAFVPFVGWFLILGVVPRSREGWVLYAGWATVSLLTLAMPLSFAYAIVRHQVIPINLIIRRGLQYLLAKNALRLLIALPVIGLILSIVANRSRPLSDILLGSSLYFYLFIAAIALALVFRKRLGEWVDRKFFRESYNQEKILRELTDDVKKLDSIPEMSKRVTERVTAALHPQQTFLFYREEGTRNLSLTYTSGGTSQELKIPEEFRLLRFMEDQGSAQEFPFPQKNSLPQSEKTWLASLGTRLIVPLTGTDDRLAGLLLLGEKKSEVPYTAGDRELLETLAGQIAIVYENVRLKNRVDRDRKIKQEVLSRVAGQDMNVLKECPSCGACFDMTAQTCDRDGTELTLSLPVERTIETRYRLERLIGKGGMGAVYEATDLRLHRKVAVKILTGSMFGNSEALRRFEREAQASARLHHPNIITIHDYGLLSTEGAYLVMELVAGETLGARLKRERQLAPATAAHIFEQILDGLKSAHAAGVIHRDLKPENVLLSTYETGHPRVHLLDFGLAKFTQALPADSLSPTAAPPVTTPGAVMGTFGYMSPEQLTGGAVDERSDLFSIGVMVVEAITGRRPFTGTTYHELLTNILNASYHLEDTSPAAQQLDAVLQKSLAKDRAARYATAAAMQQELTPALSQCPPPVSSEEPAALDAETFILKS